MRFENFTNEGISDFYNHIIELPPIKNYYLAGIYVVKTSRGYPKKKMLDSSGFSMPYTGAGAAGHGSIVEKVYFTLRYRNINYKKILSRKGLYIRGIIATDDRTGGYKILWKNKTERGKGGVHQIY